MTVERPNLPVADGSAGGGLWRALQILDIYPPNAPEAAAFRAKQIEAVLRLTPMTMLANVLNASLVANAFWATASHVFLVCWMAFVLAVASIGARPWLAMRRGQLRQVASKRAIRRATLHASVLGATWAAVPVALFHGSDSQSQMLVACICAGMICAGGFALATIPSAAIAYVLILSAGSAIALFDFREAAMATLSLLLCIYGFIVVASVISAARTFGARLMAEAHAEKQTQVIGLLLRDFEESASDVLWEIDASGRLRHVSPRLADMLDKNVDTLAGTTLVGHLEQHDADRADAERAAIEAFRGHLDAGEPFRDHAIPISVRDETRWWSITAKPLKDAAGGHDGWRGVASDITHARRAHERIAHLAHHDTLTGLSNRHQFLAQLRAALGEVRETGLPCAVACLDLDNFKDVNDALGHQAGDQLLQIVARRLLAITRRSDVVARLGGDEFGLVLVEAGSLDEVRTFVRRLLDHLEQPCELDGVRVNIAASVGIALAPSDGLDPSALMRNADFALYAAKADGKGKFRFFEPAMARTLERRQMIERALRHALEDDSLNLHYQPQISLESGKVTRFEALLRWQHPIHGELMPNEFIPIAESSGLIVHLGKWVLNRACRDAQAWPRDIGLAVNISPTQIAGQDLSRLVADVLVETGFPSHRLEIEITETAFINEAATTLDQLQSLHRMGVRLSLDDFGTGYASLGYLRRLPFDTLKIDRSFVHEMLDSAEARAIVRSVVELAGTLDISTVAEGVENVFQLDALIADGCTQAQGNHLGVPMDAGSLGDYLARGPSNRIAH